MRNPHVGGTAIYVGSPVGPGGSIRAGDRVRIIRVIGTAARIIPASAPATSKKAMRAAFESAGVGVNTDFLVPERDHARKKKTSKVTGRKVFAAKERKGHITTAGRRSLSAAEFALPPGPEEKRRGIKGRLPMDTRKRAGSALSRASMMRNEGHITEAQYRRARAKVLRRWPAIDNPRLHADKPLEFTVETEMENASGPTGTWKITDRLGTQEEADEIIAVRRSRGGNARRGPRSRAHASKRKNYSAASGDGTICYMGLTREAAERQAQRIADQTGEAATIQAEDGEEWDVTPSKRQHNAKRRKEHLRIMASDRAGYGPGRWVLQYYDPTIGVWFDIGGPKSKRDAEAALEREAGRAR